MAITKEMFVEGVIILEDGQIDIVTRMATYTSSPEGTQEL